MIDNLTENSTFGQSYFKGGLPLQCEVSKVLVREFRQGLLSQTEFRRLRYVVSHYGVVDSVWNKLSSLSQLQLENMLRPFCDTDGDYGRLIAQVRHDSRFGVKESNQSGYQSPNTLFFSHSYTMRKLHEDWLIENRHQSPKLQQAYDCRFGLVLRNN